MKPTTLSKSLSTQNPCLPQVPQGIEDGTGLENKWFLPEITTVPKSVVTSKLIFL